MKYFIYLPEKPVEVNNISPHTKPSGKRAPIARRISCFFKRSAFWAFVLKEFYHIFRDVRTMLILLGMPVIQIVLFGFAISTEVKNTAIAVYSPTRDVMTSQLLEKFAGSPYFNILSIGEGSEAWKKSMQENSNTMLLSFQPDFYQHLMHQGNAQIQIIADATDPNTATTVMTYATAIIGDFQQEKLNPPGIMPPVQAQIRLLYNPQMKGAFNFVPGVLGMILMLICAMMTSIAIVREKEIGTMEVLLVSPIRPVLIIIAKTIPYLLISCVNLATVLLLAVFVLNIPMAGSLFWILLVSLLFIFVSLSLGMLVSILTRTQLAAMLVSGMVFMMPVMLLSGMIYPTENMPLPLQLVSNLIPAKWFIAAIKNLMIKGTDLSAVLPQIGALLLMAVVLLTISLKKFKNNLE